MTNVIVPIGIMCLIGLLTGVIGHLSSSRFWITSIIAAGVATVVWVGGILVLFALMAPSELGPIIPSAVAGTFVVSLAATTTSGLLLRTRRSMRRTQSHSI